LFCWMPFDQRGNPCDCQLLLKTQREREREREWLTYYGIAIGLQQHHAQCTLAVSHVLSLLSQSTPLFLNLLDEEYHVMDSWTPNSKLVEI
jgi:hypothetical protein